MNFIVILTLATLALANAQTPEFTASSSGTSPTTIPGASTTQPGASTTQPDASTTLPGASLLTAQSTANSNPLSTTLPTADSSSSGASGIVQTAVTVQTGQSGASSSAPLSEAIQSTVSGQGSSQLVSLQSQVNTNAGLTALSSQQPSTNLQQDSSSGQMQSQMSTSNVAVSSMLPAPSTAPTNTATDVVQSSSGGGALSTAPATAATQRYSSDLQSSIIFSAATSPLNTAQSTAKGTQYPSSAVVSQQQLQSSFASSPAASVQATSKLPVASTFYTGNIQQTTWPTVKSTAYGQTTYPSGLTTFAPETATHVQIMFANNFTDAVGTVTNLTAYCEALLPYVAEAAGVTVDRITNMMVAEQPETGGVVLRFTVEPYPSGNCWWNGKCGVTVQQAILRLNSLVATTRSLRLPIANSTDLTVANYGDNYKVFQSWKDNGLCPDSTCDSKTEICDCRLTGVLYCRKVKSKPQLLYLLLLLLLIPIIIAIGFIVYYAMSRRNTQRALAEKKKNERRMVRADMLSYHEYVARDKEQVQPKVATVATVASRSTLNDSTLNTLCRSLGENISIAFNGATFVDVSGTDNSDASSSDSILPNNNQ